MAYDGRDGAFDLTFNRVVTSPDSIPEGLIAESRTALYISERSFDEKIKQLCKDAIYGFEQITATSVLPQTITVRYEYFKGKNKLPFAPHNSVTAISGYVVSGLNNKYIEGGDGGSVEITFTAGYTLLPENIKRVLVKMVEQKFKNEALANDYPSSLYSQILNFRQIID
jgi:hypothetical protein